MNQQIGAKILVVEDQEDPRVLPRYMLESAGYVMRAEADGLEGLKTFFSWRPDLVILDVLMPKMNGWELPGCIRQKVPFSTSSATARPATILSSQSS